MRQTSAKSNDCKILGRMAGNVRHSHSIYGEDFLCIEVEVMRLSGQLDVLPVTVSAKRLRRSGAKPGDFVRVQGQFRSYNRIQQGNSHLVLTVFARTMAKVEGNCDQLNWIYLDGFVCKPPVYRRTPFSREIADVLLAVNRSYNKSDYIPCICWGSNARFAGRLQVGDRLHVWGRVQSREYEKQTEKGTYEKRRAYEASIYQLKVFTPVAH